MNECSTSQARGSHWPGKTFWLCLIGLPLLAILAWSLWSEHNPTQERELRIEIQERLEEWFPEAMQLPEGLLGFVPRSNVFEPEYPPSVIMLHGLDEPGGIFDELAIALDEAGINGWEFRYPNDQAIARSANLLAEYWPALDPDLPVILLGHSMGGLVIRDFVSRHRHPVAGHPTVYGPAISGVIMIGTPNQGSDWARLRAWLEVREMFADITQREFSLFAGLRDGTGAAKIDLRPDSDFLAELNARRWPESVPVRIFGGVISEATEPMRDSLTALGQSLDPDLAEQLESWWQEAGEQVGDGAVALESLAIDGMPDPVILPASHRGLLVTLPMTDGPPAAIEPVIETIRAWHTEHDSSERDR